MSAYSDNPWFAGLSSTVADALLAVAMPMRLAPGEFVFQQGDRIPEDGPAFFGVVTGLLKVQILSPEGKEAILAIIEPGNWVGEVGVLDGVPRTSSAVAMADTGVLAVSGARFTELMQHGEFARAIARMVAGRLRLAYGVMSDSALLSMRKRVARRLLLLAHGDISLSEGKTTLSISQEVVAMLLGISRPTLNKELHALSELGAIELRYSKIHIKDMGILRHCGDSDDG